MKYAAKVSADGQLQIAESVRWRAALARLKGQVVYVILEKLQPLRSLRANSRYWVAIVPVAAEFMSEGRDEPLTSKQAHYALKLAFLGYVDTPLGRVPKSTANLPVDQFLEYTQRIEHWLLHDYNYVVPERGESLEEAIA